MKHLIVLTQDPSTQSLLRSIASASGIELSVTASLVQLIEALPMTANEPCAVLLGLDALIGSGRSAKRAVAKIRERLANVTVILHAERKCLIDKFDTAWARMCGADSIVAKLSASRWPLTGEALLRHIESDDETLAKIQHRVAPFIRAAQPLELQNERLKNVAAVEARGIDLAATARRMGRSGGVDIRNRSYHLKNYPECFVASDAVAWLSKAFNVTPSIAIDMGRALQACGLIYHVAREQNFDREYHFYRVAALPESFVVADFVTQVTAGSGFDRRARSYHGIEYPNCFVGKDAIAWCCDRRLTLNEAMTAAQRLVELSIVSHVVDEHPIKDDHFFYRFHSV
jgi:hypothetical protein